MTKKPLFGTISIVGVGLIGGSLGLSIRKHKLARFVVGVVRRKKTAVEAVKRHAADMVTMDLKEGVADADLVILCAPVSTIAKQIKEIAPFLKKGAIVTDVGSSKLEIERAARRYLKKNTFVGSHPMAGLATTGVENAINDLFEGAQCFMTAKNTAVERFWREVGCVPVCVSAKEHDAWVAQFSHLPHILAFALFQNSPKLKNFKASNPSLRDLARIAKSDPQLWTDILFSNRTEILKTLSRFQKNLRALEAAVRSKSPSKTKNFISKANQISSAVAP